MKKLLIFDCDGVLVDSEIIANRIDAEMLSEHGYPTSTEHSIRKFTGMSASTVRDFIFKESGVQLPDNFAELTQRRILKAFEEELRPLIYETLERYSHMTKCVASSSSRERVLKSLELTKQNHFFPKENVFTSSQVKRGKPFPDLFLFAAEQMGINPASCLVVEDSVAGIEAAKRAGMSVVAFLGGSHARFDWYQHSIQSLNVPIALDAKGLIDRIELFLKS